MEDRALIAPGTQVIDIIKAFTGGPLGWAFKEMCSKVKYLRILRPMGKVILTSTEINV